MTKEALRSEKSTLLEALKSAGADVSNPGRIKCPFHDDAHASSSIYEKDGVWRFQCHGCKFGGDIFDVRAKTSGEKIDKQLHEFREPEQRRQRVYPSILELEKSVPNRTHTFIYSNPETRKADMIVFRMELAGDKTFWQASAVSDGFVLKAPPKPWPLYNRARVASSQVVIVVEGEKCVHAVHEAGHVATTSPGGAGKAKLVNWTPLAGKKVYLWPDNDQAGKDHMRDVARILQLLNPQPNLLWIDPEQFNLPPKGDVVDYLDEWRGSASDNKIAVQAALDQAQPMDGAGELSQLIEDTIAGKRFNVPWPWPELTRLTRALMPGTVTCLCGDGGATKSYLLLQAAYFWFANDFQFVIYELEEDRAYHLNRLLAQLAENSDLTDSDWIKSHPDESREATRKFQVSIGEFAKWMQDAPDEQLSLDELKNWTLQMASAGKRVIVIDPITAAKQEDKPWIADLNFVMAVKTIARQHGASIILVTHPRKGRRTVTTIHDLAGGAAYQRFAQTVLWIQRLDQEKNVIVRRSYGTGHQDQAVSINRTLQIHKARNGRGSGLEIGFNFSGNSLLFAEQGVITEDA